MIPTLSHTLHIVGVQSAEPTDYNVYQYSYTVRRNDGTITRSEADRCDALGEPFHREEIESTDEIDRLICGFLGIDDYAPIPPYTASWGSDTTVLVSWVTLDPNASLEAVSEAVRASVTGGIDPGDVRIDPCWRSSEGAEQIRVSTRGLYAGLSVTWDPIDAACSVLGLKRIGTVRNFGIDAPGWRHDLSA